jgi:hypothetical protein
MPACAVRIVQEAAPRLPLPPTSLRSGHFLPGGSCCALAYCVAKPPSVSSCPCHFEWISLLKEIAARMSNSSHDVILNERVLGHIKYREVPSIGGGVIECHPGSQRKTVEAVGNILVPDNCDISPTDQPEGPKAATCHRLDQTHRAKKRAERNALRPKTSDLNMEQLHKQRTAKRNRSAIQRREDRANRAFKKEYDMNLLPAFQQIEADLHSLLATQVCFCIAHKRHHSDV